MSQLRHRLYQVHGASAGHVPASSCGIITRNRVIFKSLSLRPRVAAPLALCAIRYSETETRAVDARYFLISPRNEKPSGGRKENDVVYYVSPRVRSLRAITAIATIQLNVRSDQPASPSLSFSLCFFLIETFLWIPSRSQNFVKLWRKIVPRYLSNSRSELFLRRIILKTTLRSDSKSIWKNIITLILHEAVKK